MEKVKVKKAELQDILKKNLEAHKKAFEKAEADYKVAASGLLKEMLADLEAGKSIDRYLKIEEPDNHERDYERALKMLEMSVDETIEISVLEFSRFVEDDWAWKMGFSASNHTLSAVSETYR